MSFRTPVTVDGATARYLPMELRQIRELATSDDPDRGRLLMLIHEAKVADPDCVLIPQDRTEQARLVVLSEQLALIPETFVTHEELYG